MQTGFTRLKSYLQGKNEKGEGGLPLMTVLWPGLLGFHLLKKYIFRIAK